MAIGLRLKFNGGTQEQYEAAHGHMGVENDPPAGSDLPLSGPIDEGWGVIDFWESRGASTASSSRASGRPSQELDDRAMQDPPDIKQFPVHNYTKPY
jgi:hypothetical protein